MFLQPEKAILVGIELQEKSKIPLSESMQELKNLADTAGALVVGELSQKRTKPDQKYYLGSGKVQELKALVLSQKADMAIFDVELSPAQERNLEDALGIKVIDRTELIIDIFAQHAKSREGKLQVELAQTNFLLTRLTGHGVLMSRLGGGIGTRGPGETKLEYDRRRIRNRIAALRKETERVRKDRQIQREKRRKSRFPSIALVGYTNSGKSTLFNNLSKASVLTEDKLFATLDTTVRRVYLPAKNTILLSDTVGFIQKLPHQLVTAFRATLEEALEADMLMHVVDVSNPYFEDQIEAVFTVLEELKCSAKQILTVFNKIDQLEKPVSNSLFKKYQPAVAVSALYGTGIADLLKILEEKIKAALI
jgi:GTP-binding protein HflX